MSLAEEKSSMADPAQQTVTNAEDGRWSELLQPRHLAATVTLCLGVALFAFNEFFVSTALPTAVVEFGGASLLSWAFTLYLVFAIVGGALAANQKARFGARNTLVAAALVFATGTIIATMASSMPQVLAGRVLQGLGEGVIAALCYALIPELFPQRLVPKIFGAEAIVWAGAAFGGPLISGLLTEYWSWRAAFFVNIPAAAIFVVLVVAIVRQPAQSPGGSAGSIPLLRLVTFGVGILLVSLSSTATNDYAMAGLLAAAIAVFVSTVRLDRRSRQSILPFGAFSPTHSLGAGLWVILLMPLAQASGSVYLVYALQQLWGFGPTAAGFSNALMAISWSLTAILIASLRSHEMRVQIVWTGPLMLCLGLVGLALAVGTGEYKLVFISQAAIGAGFGLCWGTLSQLLMNVSTIEERDKTSALLPTLQSAGYAIGAAVFGAVANAGGFDEGASNRVISAALLGVFAVGATLAAASVFFGITTLRLARCEGKVHQNMP
ncbi:MFS transporter [Sinorhizobium medicae]|uniref:Major facilitator superfamily MFS_1 n=5 Tax=Sinorhizobium medicae TaxID=110321 RepID=A6U8X5_SINMW|nr:major facilitator superfamily MFS_1 [Sinorhizobium medicae WSM419]MDX0406440.1 MFS transporter [Sinorhizobium medicae]MDX0412076.1 MFS transporter [Sinorhizobium medicae]MDX0418025.1 MFS transporter [Sinorhizobium medicae]MDX0425373.1 MFS transporter [Sinorhizobium medicae]